MVQSTARAIIDNKQNNNSMIAEIKRVNRTKILHKPMRLPRKLKKDIIKTSGREAYWQIMGYMALQVMMGGTQYITIRKTN